MVAGAAESAVAPLVAGGFRCERAARAARLLPDSQPVLAMPVSVPVPVCRHALRLCLCLRLCLFVCRCLCLCLHLRLCLSCAACASRAGARPRGGSVLAAYVARPPRGGGCLRVRLVAANAADRQQRHNRCPRPAGNRRPRLTATALSDRCWAHRATTTPAPDARGGAARCSRLRALSTSFNDAPQTSSRPFDVDRDGCAARLASVAPALDTSVGAQLARRGAAPFEATACSFL